MKFKKNKWIFISLSGGMAVILATVGILLFSRTEVAHAAADLKTITQSTTGPGLLGEGYLAHGGGGRGGLRGIDYQKLLADALGITVDQLTAAYEQARTAAIEQAVTQGLITREQADEMLVWGGLGHKGWNLWRRGAKGVTGSKIDENALLAEALGITVEQLETAREKANLAAIEQAVAEGIITQEQADEMLARKKLQDYLDRDVLLAKALGMTVEELKSAYAAGKTLTTLMQEKGLDAATVRSKLQTAYQEALAQAVKDGVITQEQADEMKDGRGGGPMMWGDKMPGGPGSRGRGKPGEDGDNAKPDKSGGNDKSGTGFQRPGRSIQGNSKL